MNQDLREISTKKECIFGTKWSGLNGRWALNRSSFMQNQQKFFSIFSKVLKWKRIKVVDTIIHNQWKIICQNLWKQQQPDLPIYFPLIDKPEAKIQSKGQATIPGLVPVDYESVHNIKETINWYMILKKVE